MAAPSLDGEIRPRRRRNTLFLFVGIALLAFSAVAAGVYVVKRPVTLRIAVGPADSSDKSLIQAIATQFAHDGSPIRLALKVTAGSAESLALLTSGHTDIAVVRGDRELPRDTQSLAIMRKNVVVIWAPSGRGSSGKRKAAVKEVGDLAGRRIGVVGRSDANVKLLKVILTESGVAPDKVRIAQFTVEQAAQMARDPSLDAFMTVGPLDSKITAEAIAISAEPKRELTFIPIDVSDTIARKQQLYESDKIPASSFGSKPARPQEEVETVSVNHLIVARAELPESSAAAFTRQLLTVRQRLSRDNPDAAKIEKPDTDKSAAVPAHPGAAAYIDGTERTFLERYGDYFWIGILMLSILGSAGAWLGHYLKRDERIVNTAHRDKLMGTIARVRSAGSLAELKELQSDVDALLQETLDCYDDGAIEEGDLKAVDLVLTQLHRALSDRRIELTTELPDMPENLMARARKIERPTGL
ncbi:MAG: TAXI family TRAP transporter solute-binding subunit [Bradyrhizobiaceae bacterium]|nr:MAG: TAXI family TRAP transporter solute-binding subunit [Bradyrhizobiaceae bacterium]